MIYFIHVCIKFDNLSIFFTLKKMNKKDLGWTLIVYMTLLPCNLIFLCMKYILVFGLNANMFTCTDSTSKRFCSINWSRINLKRCHSGILRCAQKVLLIVLIADWHGFVFQRLSCLKYAVDRCLSCFVGRVVCWICMRLLSIFKTCIWQSDTWHIIDHDFVKQHFKL